MTHEQKYLKMIASEKFKKLERLSKKTYLGSLQMDNDIKLTSNLYADTEKWEYVIKLHVTINGKTRNLHKTISMDDIGAPEDLSKVVREMCVKDLAKHLSSDFFRQNLTAINQMDGVHVG